MPLRPGDRFERWTVVRELGSGGLAVVYLVQHDTLGTLHALKLLHDSAAPDLRSRLIEEGRVQARLNHPNVVRVTDVVDGSGATGLVMDFVEGASLEDRLLEGRIPPADVMPLFTGIVHGVRAAHAMGVVHRDLKPANVLLAKDGTPKVADFGLAKALGGGGTHRTRTGMVMGTPAYMAPEQAVNAKGVDHRADLFALGAILYELAVGRRAFGGDSLRETFEAVVHCRYTAPTEVVPDLDPRIDQAIRGLLRRDPEDRLESCDALLDVLAGRRTVESARSNSTMELDLFDVAEVAPAPASSRGLWIALAVAVGVLVLAIAIGLGVVLVAVVSVLATS